MEEQHKGGDDEDWDMEDNNSDKQDDKKTEIIDNYEDDWDMSDTDFQDNNAAVKTKKDT
jgi:hypothetical protein